MVFSINTLHKEDVHMIYNIIKYSIMSFIWIRWMMASTIEVPSCAVLVDDSLVIGIVSHIQLRHQEMVNKVTSYIDLRLIPSWERTVTAYVIYKDRYITLASEIILISKACLLNYENNVTCHLRIRELVEVYISFSNVLHSVFKTYGYLNINIKHEGNEMVRRTMPANICLIHAAVKVIRCLLNTLNKCRYKMFKLYTASDGHDVYTYFFSSVFVGFEPQQLLLIHRNVINNVLIYVVATSTMLHSLTLIYLGRDGNAFLLELNNGGPSLSCKWQSSCHNWQRNVSSMTESEHVCNVVHPIRFFIGDIEVKRQLWFWYIPICDI